MLAVLRMLQINLIIDEDMSISEISRHRDVVVWMARQILRFQKIIVLMLMMDGHLRYLKK